MKIVGAIFQKTKILNFFSYVNYPYFWGQIENGKNRQKIFARGRQMSNLKKIGKLVQVLFQLTDRKLKTIFLVSGIFPGKVNSVILLVFECTINPQNLIKIVGAIFDKFEIVNFFLCELPLLLGVTRKRKDQAEDICKGTPDVEF